MVDSVYTASTGIMGLLFTSAHNGAEIGTGIDPLLREARNLVGPKIPQILIDYNIGTQINLFGSYPSSNDFGPSLTFSILFAIVFVFHLIIFIINTSRGHYFYLSVVWMFYSIFKVIGFGLRAQWSYDVTQVAIGLTSEVFLLVPSIIIVSANLILAQRLFTWRHPVGGSRTLFWSFMINTYVFVVILIAVTILASFVPYLNFLSYTSYRNWIHTVQFTAVMVILYSLTSVALIGLSFWLPTKKDELRYTYQPWWIESFAPFYFVEKNAAQKAERGFMKRNSNHRHATRVIAATHHHFHSVKGLSNRRGTLKHNISMGLLIVTTVLIFIAAICRAVVVFQARQHRFASPAENKYLMYVVWGVFELIVMILYIVGRVDLRFYRPPDRLPLEVRRIITAEQTYYPSSDEDDEGFHRDRPETYEKMRHDNIAHGYKNSESRMEPAHLYPERDDGRYDEESAFDEDAASFDDDVDSNEWDFTVPKTKTTSSSSDEPNEKYPPYPVSEKPARHSSDNESEFHF
ncbi:hypothetical protein CORT_0C06100 [Candida orthopsilosis Co 90-125]|uniref:Uncharacterized protein n=1 Tax=Candida orthopsilosis (strain 90-125) TaxID=1136231 RepID=H8X431_CANO9|nr:hypothetical protein CORT_0C06100 [Candida orthopsilosis Co 90-125]CCG25983.1 hypothetical protein CORT_0C06100 [Candida orthopsilosis Co 90-125]